MLIEKILYYGDDFCFHFGDINIEDGKFKSIVRRKTQAPSGTNLILPGLVDIHLHGNSGVDFSNGSYDSLVTMARFLARAGTTSFSPASMTLPERNLSRAYRTAVRLREAEPNGCASICGITMEGPFFNTKKKGAQAEEYLRMPDIDMLCRLQQAAGGMIRIACIAPELEGAKEYISAAGEMGLTVAAAHTDASYDEAVVGFDAGISHLTHLYNAMPPLLHRAPGVIGAASERQNVTAELICDGVHVHSSAVRAAFKLFGAERICLISDALAACGIKDGICMLGGQRVTVKDGRAVLENGTIAGSVATLFECVKKAITFGIPAKDALRCATANPARVLDMDEIGSITVGKRADFLQCSSDWTLKKVYLRGRELKRI